MTAKIIPLPIKPGARDALIDVVSVTARTGALVCSPAIYADWLLMQLAVRGFVLTPMEEK